MEITFSIRGSDVVDGQLDSQIFFHRFSSEQILCNSDEAQLVETRVAPLSFVRICCRMMSGWTVVIDASSPGREFMDGF